jgi:hypothetical protein
MPCTGDHNVKTILIQSNKQVSFGHTRQLQIMVYAGLIYAKALCKQFLMVKLSLIRLF